MFPIIPVVMVGGVIVAGLKAHKKIALKKKLEKILKQTDKHYQHIIQKHVDPLFANAQRTRQIQEFSNGYNPEEADINRRLGLSLLTSGLVISGSLWYSPLLLPGALGMIYVMMPVMHDSLRSLLFEKRIKYRLFASLSILASLLGGFYITTSLIILLFFLAFKIVARTEAYAHVTLADAFSLQAPTKVWVLADGQELEIPFADLKVNDCIVLHAGQTIPVDGEIIQGSAMIDQHALTGESQPLEKTVSDQVIANTLLLSGVIHVRIMRTGNATLAAQISKILQEATHYRSQHEARSEQLADRLTLPVLTASTLALFSVGPSGAAAILNSGFGSTMFLVGPLNLLSYLNSASHQGILVKDGRALDILPTVDTVIFDKTGTLTLEQPVVSIIHCLAEWHEEQILEFAAQAEYRQTHPIAKAILAAAESRGISYKTTQAATYEVGFGIRMQLQEQTIAVGSIKFMRQQGFTIPDKLLPIQEACHANGHSLVMVALDQQVIGAIELQAQLRAGTEALIQSLKMRGLKTFILSGDHEQPTQYLANALNIDGYFADVLPEDKAKIIESLQQDGKKVCFIGDGLNDAIALQQADVSISLRGATTLATDSAQVVLVNPSLLLIDQLFTLAKDFNQNLNQTMKIAFIPGSALIAGVFLLHFGMPAALVLYGSGLSAAMIKATRPTTHLAKQDNAAHE